MTCLSLAGSGSASIISSMWPPNFAMTFKKHLSDIWRDGQAKRQGEVLIPQTGLNKLRHISSADGAVCRRRPTYDQFQSMKH